MKKTITTVLISLSLLSQAHAEEYIDYVSVGLALQNIDNKHFDDGLAIVANAGKNFYGDMALEFEGATSIQKIEAKAGDTRTDVDFWSIGVYGVYIWKINNLSIKPRLGIVFENIKSTINIKDPENPFTPTEKSDIAISGGIGLSYQFNQNYAVFTNYTKFEDDINHLTFGGEYKF
jgi:hypothetical protein